MKRFRVYMLATLPFVAVFAYWVLGIIPSRPEVSDPIHGYAFAITMGDGGPPHYISTFDCAMTLFPFVIAVMIMGFGMWRAGAFRVGK
jgi:hypothetical protein